MQCLPVSLVYFLYYLTHLPVGRKKCILVNEVTTLRHHAEAHFAGKYRKWAKQHLFESMLPGDVKAHKENAAQQSINAHLTECKVAERVIPYSSKLFRQAAVEWLMATDQVRLSSSTQNHD